MAEQRRSHEDKDALLEDLESLRTVLEKDRQDASSRAANPSGRGDRPAAEQTTPEVQKVPVQNQPVDDALPLEELPPMPESGITDASSGLDDALFEALLGDAWRSSATRILEAGRAEIEEHRNRWLPEDTDKLNEALRERIDTTLRRWLKELVGRNLGELQSVLLNAVADQLQAQIDEVLSRQTGGHDSSNERHADQHG